MRSIQQRQVVPPNQSPIEAPGEASQSARMYAHVSTCTCARAISTRGCVCVCVCVCVCAYRSTRTSTQSVRMHTHVYILGGTTCLTLHV